MTYAINRYPVHLIDVLRLADGRRTTIRPTLPQDAELQQSFFQCLSMESRFRRFMTRFSDVPETLVGRFASIDYSNHLALLAEVFEAGRETMIGEARYVVDERDPKTCEFAVAVADAWQACGVGRTLLQRLEGEATAAGLHRIVADTLITNSAMLRLAARTGYAVQVNVKDASLARLEKRLANSPASPTPSSKLRAA